MSHSKSYKKHPRHYLGCFLVVSIVDIVKTVIAVGYFGHELWGQAIAVLVEMLSLELV